MNPNLSTFLLKYASLNGQKLFHSSSYSLASYYDILKLQSNCSSKEIRDSFIKLSKENHPDINKSPNAHKEFLKIQEAYNILSKPEKRASYDLGLSSFGPGLRYGSHEPYYKRPGPIYRTPPPSSRNPWDDPSFYANRDKSQDAYYEAKPYYGIRGIKRQSNGTIAFYIGAFTVIMFVLQMIAIRHTVASQQNLMDKRSMETQKLLNEIKEKAERNGNKVQMEIHRRQFEEMERWRAEQAGRQN